MNWKAFCALAILFQFILTLNHIKFFPFSDHGVFEIYRKADGQRFYRAKTIESFPEYIEEGILYEISYKIKNLHDSKGLNANNLKDLFGQPVQQVDEFRLWKNPDQTGVAIEKNVVYRKY